MFWPVEVAEPPVLLITIWFGLLVSKDILLPAIIDLKFKLAPVLSLNKPIPAPVLLAVFISPILLTLIVTVSVSGEILTLDPATNVLKL